MPPVLSVVPEDLPALRDFGEEVWQGQHHGDGKKPFTIAFTSTSPEEAATPESQKGQPAWPAFRDPETGNEVVDKAVGRIRSQTHDHWLAAPRELVQLLSTGDASGLEGTEGYIFPPMVISNGVFMILCTYAHSGLLNVLASMFEDGIEKEDLPMLRRMVRDVGNENMAYLRSLSLGTICSVFDDFFTALDAAQTVEEVRSLVSSISLFGALMHGWFVFWFPYRVGAGLRRKREVRQEPLKLFQIGGSSHGRAVPLRSREGRGLGVATWNEVSPAEREQLSANGHLPANLEAASDDLPLVVRMQPFASKNSSTSVKELAIAARPIVEQHLPAHGAILFRGLPLPTFSEASDFLRSLGYAMYPDPSGRDKVAEGLYHASLAVPADMNIGPHQEHIVSTRPPSKLFLYCQAPSPEGGETPLAHACKVWDLMRGTTRDQLRRRGVRFEMVRGNAAKAQNPVQYTRSWQEHFRAADLPTAMERATEQFEGKIMADKHGNIILRSPPLQAFREVEGRELYCSQLQNIYSLRWLWGDADEYLPEELLEDVMSAVWSAASVFQWQAGDVLLVHNLLVLHGRLSYKGERFMCAGLTRD
jgi:alpha-ketoglutarate-dependent taurine dioxygenase